MSSGVLAQRKLILTLAFLLAALGAASWWTMRRQEDPRLPDYFGRVEVYFSGADAETVERLLLEPIEERLAEIDEIDRLESTVQAEAAFIRVRLAPTTRDVAAAWDRVRDALDRARPQLPEGASEPHLDDRVNDQEGIVLAVTGSSDTTVLAAAAERLKTALQEVPGVARVNVLADPEEQITIELDDAAARRLGLSPAAAAAQLGARSRILPGGSLRVGDRSVRLKPLTDFASLDELAATPVRLPSGEDVPLAAVARVRHGPVEPARARARFQGEPAVGLGIIARRDIHLVDLGRAVRARLATEAPDLAPLAVREVAFQPDHVAARLSGLGRSLLLGALVVAGVLVLTMGLRVGLVVSLAVPLVTFASLAMFALAGGVLHQISIAALVIALGMLVDNAIVVTEGIQWGLDRGLSYTEAAAGTVRELAVPLASATGTTLAAFVPMLLAEGMTAQFTRDIPVVIILTLSVSYAFALLVTPGLSAFVLRARPAAGEGRLVRLATGAGRLATRRPVAVVVTAAAVVVLAALAARSVRQEFFPLADRDQVVVDLRLPDGSHLEATDAAARRLEEALLDRPEVASVASFTGRSLPRFYYNVNTVPFRPHAAQLLLTARRTRDVAGLVEWTRRFGRAALPEAEVVVKPLEQGPSVRAPVEIRLFGDELPALHGAVEAVMRELAATPGAVDVRHTLSNGTPVLSYRIDDAAAARHGLARDDVAAALLRQTRGIRVGQFWAGEDPIPVVVRAPAGERLPAARLASVDLTAAGHEPVPLAEVARGELAWRPGALEHFDRRRSASVLAELAPGTTYSEVLAAVRPRLAALALPGGVSWAVGGAAEESGQANTAMGRALPIGALLLVGILMAEFRSFRRVGIVLVTVPLAAAGVVPGLLLGDQPFGFMSLLGIVALVGVVVNNAILLLEVIEDRRSAGVSVEEAVSEAVARRIRPILLTTLTTVVGLVPLALSASTLWPPLAWAMISGLSASTLLTLLVVPALYRLLFRPGAAGFAGRGERSLLPAAAGAIAAGVLLAGAPAAAASMTLAETLAQGRDRPAAEAAGHRARAAALAARAATRAGRLPLVEATAAVRERDRTLTLATPIGDFAFGASRDASATLALSQPLFDPARRRFASRAARAEATAAGAAAARAGEEAAYAAGAAFLDVLALRARRGATEAFVARLAGQLAEIRARVEVGRALESDALKVELALRAGRQERDGLLAAEGVARAALSQAVGSPEPVEPDPAGLSPEAAAAEDAGAGAAALARARRQRPELAALAARVAAAAERARAARWEASPALAGVATWTRSTGAPYREDDWVEGALALTWRPFEATRGPRTAAAKQEGEALAADLVEAERTVEVEVRAALAALETARGELEVGRLGVVQATETLRVEEERHRAGRVTTNELLEAQAALRLEETRRDLAGLELIRAGLALSLAAGDPLGGESY